MFDVTQIFHFDLHDIILLKTCPMISGLASLVRAWTTDINLLRLPPFKQIGTNEIEPALKQTKESFRKRSYWVFGMLLAGIVVGFGLAFIFLGATLPQSSSIGRVWFLALLLGFSTPIVLEKIDQGIAKI